MTAKRKIFVSRTLSGDGELSMLRENPDVILSSESLIRTVPVPFSHTPATDWIFFSSANGIRYFFSQKPTLGKKVRFGVMGPSSRKVLNERGYQADFTGEGVDLRKIALQFREVLAESTVLFPQSMDSLQTIQKHLSFANNAYNLFTYKTILRSDFILPSFDILVFTSPSNVNAYFSKYRLLEGQKFVAMGSSTRYALANQGIREVMTPLSFTESGLADCVEKLLAA